RFEQDFLLLSPFFKKMQSETYRRQVQKLGALLEKGESSKEELEELLDADFFLKGFTSSGKKAKANLQELDLEYPNLFFELHQEIYPIIKQATNPTSILLGIAEDFRKRWE